MGGKVRAWTHSVPFDEKAMVQNVASLPFVKPVAIMPDVHWGMGATIGSVIPTEGAIIPAAVGLSTKRRGASLAQPQTSKK